VGKLNPKPPPPPLPPPAAAAAAGVGAASESPGAAVSLLRVLLLVELKQRQGRMVGERGVAGKGQQTGAQGLVGAW
jgi:hypothetical protein